MKLIIGEIKSRKSEYIISQFLKSSNSVLITELLPTKVCEMAENKNIDIDKLKENNLMIMCSHYRNNLLDTESIIRMLKDRHIKNIFIDCPLSYLGYDLETIKNLEDLYSVNFFVTINEPIRKPYELEI